MVEMITTNGRSVKEDLDLMDLPIKSIKIGDRARRDMGNIKSLAESMKNHGLLVPIAVDKERKLIYGNRRILAAQRLRWKTIPAVIVKNKVEELALKQAEEAENVERKSFTPSERAQIATKIRLLKKAGPDGGEGRGKTPDSTPYWKEAGFGSETEYKAASAVVNKAESSKAAKSVQAAMDAGVLSPHGAQQLLQLPDDQIQHLVNEIGLPEDPQEIREQREAADEALRKYKAEERRKKAERAERERVSLYFEKWNAFFQLTQGIIEDHGSIKEMVQEAPWNLKRNVKHWRKFSELLDHCLPILKRFHRETKEYLEV